MPYSAPHTFRRDGSCPLGLSLPLDVLLGHKLPEEGGGPPSTGRSLREQAEQEEAGRKLLKDLISRYLREDQQQPWGSGGRDESQPAAPEAHPSTAAPASSSLNGTGRSPSAPGGIIIRGSGGSSDPVSFVGPFGLVAMPPGIDPSWLEDILIEEARAFARDWSQLRAITRGRLLGKVSASPN